MSEQMSQTRKTKPLSDRKTVRQITVDEHTVNILRTLGNGNLSAGIRKAAGIVARIAEQNK